MNDFIYDLVCRGSGLRRHRVGPQVGFMVALMAVGVCFGGAESTQPTPTPTATSTSLLGGGFGRGEPAQPAPTPVGKELSRPGGSVVITNRDLEGWAVRGRVTGDPDLAVAVAQSEAGHSGSPLSPTKGGTKEELRRLQSTYDREEQRCFSTVRSRDYDRSYSAGPGTHQQSWAEHCKSVCQGVIPAWEKLLEARRAALAAGLESLTEDEREEAKMKVWRGARRSSQAALDSWKRVVEVSEREVEQLERIISERVERVRRPEAPNAWYGSYGRSYRDPEYNPSGDRKEWLEQAERWLRTARQLLREHQRALDRVVIAAQRDGA